MKAQEDTGIQAITDGDFRRQSWSGDFLTAIEGVKLEAPPLTNQQQQQAAGTVVQNWQPPTPKTVGQLRWPAGGIQRKSFEFLKSVTTRTAKTTIPSPSMLHFRGGRGGVDAEDLSRHGQILRGSRRPSIAPR